MQHHSLGYALKNASGLFYTGRMQLATLECVYDIRSNTMQLPKKPYGVCSRSSETHMAHQSTGAALT